MPNKSQFLEDRKHSTLLFQSISKDVQIHRQCRQYYANHKLKEIEADKRNYFVRHQNETKTKIQTYTTNHRTMKREHAQLISDNLGHGRISELKSYIHL